MLILHDATGFSLALGEIDEPVVLPPFLHFGRSAASPDDVRSFRHRIKADGLDIVEWWDEPDYAQRSSATRTVTSSRSGWDEARPSGT